MRAPAAPRFLLLGRFIADRFVSTKAVDSAGDHLRAVRHQFRGREVLPRVRRRRWGCRAAGGGGAQGRHGPVLRPGRVHRAVGVGGSRGREHDARRLLRRWRERRSRATAGWCRSSSATRWWACSGCRPRTRTTRSARCGPGLRIVEAAEELEAVGGDAAAAAGRHQHRARRWYGSDVNPGSGEGFLTGDAINTASRTARSVAPEMGVAVGVATYEATTVVFDYEELEPATREGQGRAGARLPTAGSAGAVRDRSDAHARPRRSSAARSTSRC